MTSGDFQLCIDASAFDLQVLAPTKTLIIAQLDLNGKWLREDIIVNESYSNEYFSLNGKTKNITIKKSVVYLFLNPRVAPKRILCQSANTSEVYIDMHLLRQTIETGQYHLSQDCFIMTPDGLFLISLPEENSKRPTVFEMHEQSLLPMYGFFASTQLS
jgi:hypothetical protein